MTSTLNQRASTKRRAILSIGLALAMVLSGCGSSDSDDDTTTTDTESDSSTEATTSEAENGSEAPVEDSSESDGEGSTGGGTGTLTISDGTVYNLEFSSCDTSDTKPSALPLANGYDLNGRTADGFRMQIIRAGLSEEASVLSGGLEGHFDENGKNPVMIYPVNNDSVDLTVDGGSVSGTFSLRALGPDRPHGDSADATLEVSC